MYFPTRPAFRLLDQSPVTSPELPKTGVGYLVEAVSVGGLFHFGCAQRHDGALLLGSAGSPQTSESRRIGCAAIPVTKRPLTEAVYGAASKCGTPQKLYRLRFAGP
jgi:hypothetical protein